MGRRYVFAFFVVVLFSPPLSAQVMDCEQTITYATEEFNAGHFYSVPAILETCITEFTRDQRQRAFLLLTQTYLLLDDPIGAKQSFLNVLAANPEFIADERVHPIDVVYLSKRFTATPRFSWFVAGGSNITPVRVIHHLNINGSKSNDYHFRPGYNLGAGGEYSYNDQVRIRLEANFFQTSYRQVSSGHFPYDAAGEAPDKKSVDEHQTWVNFPVYVSYADNIGKYRPYAYAGLAVAYMLSDRATITRTKVERGEGPETESFEIPSPDFDLLWARNRLNQSIIFGGGIKYKLGLDFVFVDVRYSAGLRNIADPRYVYGDSRLVPGSPAAVESSTATFQYGSVTDFLRIDNVALTIGFLRPLYKPRELKRPRTKGVLRKLRRTR